MDIPLFGSFRAFKYWVLLGAILLIFNFKGYCQTDYNSVGNNATVGKYYNIRGFKMYTEVYGAGKPILMIHGNGGNMRVFKNNISEFAKTYKVILADSRAQGRSVDSQDSLSFEQMADDFAELLDSIHVKSAYLIGFSDGGVTALLLAMRHPDKVIKLASTGANLWPDSTAIKPGYWKNEQTKFNYLKTNKPANLKEKNECKIFLLDWLQPNLSLKDLKAVTCPSLIIGGDHDVILLHHIVDIYQNLPNAYLWILPNSGHATLIEHSDEFNKKVGDFFNEPFKYKR